mgnify:CR=1 FL=1
MRKIKKVPPSAKQMSKFARLFTKKQWEQCCEQPEFVDLVVEDIPKAQNIAIRILNDTYEIEG